MRTQLTRERNVADALSVGRPLKDHEADEGLKWETRRRLRSLIYGVNLTLIRLFDTKWTFFACRFGFPNTDHVTVPRRVFSFKVGHLRARTQSF